MTGNELRKKFLKYFEGQGHVLVPSSSLVPKSDPTLLFTNAGMVPFKNVFLGEEQRGYTRAASVQKCVRAGGKHNDLEMVGHTARHHTFFEMLGNFSFGDYFKKEAIRYGWEFLTEEIGLPKDKLYVSVYKDDDEAFDHWHKDIGLATDRIYRLGDKDNFWAMGDTGPCGPCSEIFIDQGEAIGCGKPTCEVGCDCDRYLEIWNLVFMQYDRDASGKMSPLPNPCIDTGMGLERLAAVVQGQHSNFHCDLLMGLMDEVSLVTGKSYGQKKDQDGSIRVISDHARTAAFLVGDGVLPSNEGRGYVLRRIIRRALRHGKLLDQSKPFFYRITDKVIENYKDVYPELEVHAGFIKKVVLNEEENFSNTLNMGFQRVEEILQNLKKKNSTTLPGEEIFKLYDTYGFPVDLAEEMAKDAGVELDMKGFEKAMQSQKEKAQASWKGSGEKEVAPFFKEFIKNSPATLFQGYSSTHGEGKILAILKNGASVETASVGDEVELLLDQTPFYGESGGQVGDQGLAFNLEVHLEIMNATKPLSELIVHKARVMSGTLKVSDCLKLEVSPEKRGATALNHTSTHLLQAALHEVLGDHVKQAGSLVTSDRLRFDYTHFSPLTEREKNRIEALVNEKIRENIPVETEEMKIENAMKAGAMALFGEKYGNEVRVVSVPGFSKELCGGTHITATGDIGLFRIISETGIASGVRRIEAVTGKTAYEKIQAENETLNAIRALLKVQPDEEVSRVKKLIEKTREAEKEVAALKEKLVSGKGSNLMDEVKKIGDVSLLLKMVDGMDAKTLRTFIDNAKNQMGSGVVVVGTAIDGKVMLAAGVTKDLTDRFQAGAIIKEIAGIVGGSGGGRPDMAQAGGTKVDKIGEALARVETLLKEK
ncbi:MAG: alanine--tRNA ligase [Nitrospinae bacterium]|jgi:alanyl-tRNA synthetase|nr:alanine--tRNA ligase [Nitrospinota bacterium]MDA1110482.1 alanine--tRNA ligase [Nitrospinota bacterium]